MFRLLRYFSIASLLSIVAASIGLSVLHRQLAISNVTHHGEAGNEAVVRVLINVCREPLRALLTLAPTLSAEELKVHPQLTPLREAIQGAVKGTDIVRVKAFTLDGRTVYSSEEAQVGESGSSVPGFASARAGQVKTELSQISRTSALEPQRQDRTVLSTYWPLRLGDSDHVDGVMEVYQDITPFLTWIDAMQEKVMMGVASVLLMLYGALFLIVRRADRILRRQEGQYHAATEALRESHHELKQRTVMLGQQVARKAAVLNAAFDCVISTDVHGVVTEFNPSAERTFGWRRDEALGRSLAELILPPAPLVVHTEGLRRFAATGAPNLFGPRIEVTAQRKSGECFPAELAISEVRIGSEWVFTAYLRDISDRKCAERALQDSESANRRHAAFLETLLNALPIGVSLIGKDLRVMSTNTVCLSLLDFPSGVIEPGVSVHSVFLFNARRGEYGPGDPAVQAEQRVALVRAQKPHRMERVRPNGTVIEIHSVPLSDGSMVTTYTDITERKQVETWLRESERKTRVHAIFLQALLDALPLGISVIDKNHQLAASNEAYAKLLDLPPELLRPGTPLESIFRFHAERGEFGEGDPDTLVAERMAQATEGALRLFDRVRPNGTVLEVRGVPLPDGGEVLIHIDVTSRRQAEIWLRERESKTRERAIFIQALLDALPVGVALIDKNQKVLVANEASIRLQGLPDSLRMPGTSMEDVYRHHAGRGVFGPGDVETLVAERVARTRDPSPHRAVRDYAHGTMVEVRSQGMPDGGRVTTYTDISDHIRAERELRDAKEAAEAASQAKSAFLAVMSHEIRTPMNAVIGLLELFRLSPLDAQQQDTVDTVRESSKSLLRLIDDVLDFSKIEAGKIELHEEVSSLPRMFAGAQNVFSAVASHKGLLLTQSVDPRIAPAIMVDRLRLRQIINNLLSNAIKFTEQGQVALTAELVGQDATHERVRVMVQDTGVGISPEAQERLFQPFSQADATVERRYGGTGLGLAICKRLADLMGATIDVQSEPGVGTRMSLTLSLRRSDLESLKEKQPVSIDVVGQFVQGRRVPAVETARAQGRLILVADDHPINRRLQAQQLNALGYAVVSAAHGGEALTLWRDGGFGLLITDCQMPVMDGYQLSAEIRRIEAQTCQARLPIIGCTANVSREALDQCFAAGMDATLPKPVELAAFQAVLDRWIPAPPVGEGQIPSDSGDSDFATIEFLAQGDSALLRDLLQDLRKANADDLAVAARGMEEHVAGHLQHAAHRIRGAASTVGADRLATAAGALEQAAQGGDWQRISHAWPVLRQECERLEQRIARLIGP